MAKKKNQIKTKAKQKQPENALPQNILPMGERVEEDKNIYISQKVYKQIHKFTHNKTTNESGGMLVGSVIEEFGKTNIMIHGFVEAKYCEGTPTTLTFTHETWDYVHKEVDKKYPGMKILGWIHTHPNFGIFLSEYDKFIHENFFSEPNQIAYVVDPIQKIEGFYFWINGKLERCKGFYIFDKTGARIDVDVDTDEPEAAPKKESVFSWRNILTAILCIAMVFLIFANISANSELELLGKQQQSIVDANNQNVLYLQQYILQLQNQIVDLQAQVDALDQAVNPPEETTGEVVPEADAQTEVADGGQ